MKKEPSSNKGVAVRKRFPGFERFLSEHPSSVETRGNLSEGEFSKGHEQLSDMIRVLLLKWVRPHNSTEAEQPHSECMSNEGKAHVREFVSSIIDPLTEVISSGDPVQFVTRCDRRLMKYTIHPKTGPDGALTDISVLGIEVSRQEALETAFLLFNDKYHFLTENAPFGVGVADLDGNAFLVNSVMVDITGYSLEELKSAGVAVNYRNENERKQVIEALQESGKVRNYKVELKRKNGIIYSALLNIDQINLAGLTLLVTSLSTDSNRLDQQKNSRQNS